MIIRFYNKNLPHIILQKPRKRPCKWSERKNPVQTAIEDLRDAATFCMLFTFMLTYNE